MNKCFRCGFETLENANFCSNCGIALKDPMPQIEYLTTEDTQIEEVVEDDNIEAEADVLQDVSHNDDARKAELAIIDAPVAEEIAPNEMSKDETNDEAEDLEIQTHSEKIEEKTRKILWIPEWAFCSALLILGVIGIVTYKFINDPEWNKLLPDVSGLFSVVNEFGSTEDVDAQSGVIDTFDAVKIDTPKVAEAKLEPQSIVNGDSTYHVVVMTLKSMESAEKIIASGKYDNAYIISDSTLNRIAVYNNIDKAKAKHFLDSIAKNGCPGAWIFYGAVK